MTEIIKENVDVFRVLRVALLISSLVTASASPVFATTEDRQCESHLGGNPWQVTRIELPEGEPVLVQQQSAQLHGDSASIFASSIFAKGKHSFFFQRRREESVLFTEPFEMMPTPVTQRLWVQVMGKNPSQFSNGEHTIGVSLNGEWIKMQPDNPVENVTWWSVLVFANKLSTKYDLKPVYDLSGVTFKPDTSAEDGTLQAAGGEIKINALGGSHDPYQPNIYYQAEGFRLPTEAEQEYLLRKGKDFLSDKDKTEVQKYAWTWNFENADKTHPVTQLEPIMVDGKAFYDLYANVREWSWDWYSDYLPGGTNPMGPKNGLRRVVRGGLCVPAVDDLHTTLQLSFDPNSRFEDVGFRLVKRAN